MLHWLEKNNIDPTEQMNTEISVPRFETTEEAVGNDIENAQKRFESLNEHPDVTIERLAELLNLPYAEAKDFAHKEGFLEKLDAIRTRAGHTFKVFAALGALLTMLGSSTREPIELNEHPTLMSMIVEAGQERTSEHCERVLLGKASELAVQEKSEVSFYLVKGEQGDCIIRVTGVGDNEGVALPSLAEAFPGGQFNATGVEQIHVHTLAHEEEMGTPGYIEMIKDVQDGKTPPFDLTPPGIIDFSGALHTEKFNAPGGEKVVEQKAITSLGTWTYSIDATQHAVAQMTMGKFEQFMQENVAKNPDATWNDAVAAAKQTVADKNTGAETREFLQTMVLDKVAFEAPYSQGAREAYVRGDKAPLHKEMQEKLTHALKFSEQVAKLGLNLSFTPHPNILQELGT